LLLARSRLHASPAYRTAATGAVCCGYTADAASLGDRAVRPGEIAPLRRRETSGFERVRGNLAQLCVSVLHKPASRR
jgi:hypothetical protein